MRKQVTPGETNQHEKLHRTTIITTRQEMTKVYTIQVERQESWQFCIKMYIS